MHMKKIIYITLFLVAVFLRTAGAQTSNVAVGDFIGLTFTNTYQMTNAYITLFNTKDHSQTNLAKLSDRDGYPGVMYIDPTGQYVNFPNKNGDGVTQVDLFSGKYTNFIFTNNVTPYVQSGS